MQPGVAEPRAASGFGDVQLVEHRQERHAGDDTSPLGDTRLHVSTRATLQECVLSCGIPFHGKPDHDIFVREMARLSARTMGLRRTGACSVDFAFVAAGRWDAYWERTLNAWDMAPGVILVQEAGGVATGVDGASLELDGGHVLVTNGAIHGALAARLERARRGEDG